MCYTFTEFAICKGCNTEWDVKIDDTDMCEEAQSHRWHWRQRRGNCKEGIVKARRFIKEHYKTCSGCLKLAGKAKRASDDEAGTKPWVPSV